MATETNIAASTTTLVLLEVPRGDRAQSATLVRWYVAPGDTVETGTAVCLLRTEHFLYDLPASVSGVIEACFVEPGASAHPGDALLSIVPIPAEPSTEAELAQASAPRATPLARAIAVAHGLDLHQIACPRSGGRIWAADVRALLGMKNSHPPDQAAQLRRTQPDLLPTSFNRDQHLQALTVHDIVSADQDDISVAMIVYATAQVLIQHPWLNSRWTDDGVIRYGRIDLGVRQQIPTGIRIRLLRNAADLSLRGIEHAMSTASVHDSAESATFWISLSNRTWWSEQSIPVGASAVLHIGCATNSVMVEEPGEHLVIRIRRFLALSYDIRHIAQVEADALLSDVQKKVERQRSL